MNALAPLGKLLRCVTYAYHLQPRRGSLILPREAYASSWQVAAGPLRGFEQRVSLSEAGERAWEGGVDPLGERFAGRVTGRWDLLLHIR